MKQSVHNDAAEETLGWRLPGGRPLAQYALEKGFTASSVLGSTPSKTYEVSNAWKIWALLSATGTREGAQ